MESLSGSNRKLLYLKKEKQVNEEMDVEAS
jgi:hypothetical protein